MIAPPGKPKIVETPSSMRDWQIALAPFKRIDVLISVERTVALYLVDPRLSRGTKNPASYRGEVNIPAVPPCLDTPPFLPGSAVCPLSAVYRPPPPRRLL